MKGTLALTVSCKFIRNSMWKKYFNFKLKVASIVANRVHKNQSGILLQKNCVIFVYEQVPQLAWPFLLRKRPPFG